MARLWDQPSDYKNSKLRVQFDANSPPPSIRSKTNIDPTLTDPTQLNDQKQIFSTNDLNNSSLNSDHLKTLKKKYDAVVDYTVRLTADRDELAAQLDQLQRESVKDSKETKKRDLGAKKMDKKNEDGVSIFLLFIVTLIAFFIGRLTSSSS